MASSTSIQLGASAAVVATSGVGYSVVISGLPAGIKTYYLTVYNDGSNSVSIHPAGLAAIPQAAAKRIAAGETITVGPLRVLDGQPRLFASADTDCIVDLDPVSGEA